MNLEMEKRRGDKARQYLEDEFLKEILDSMEKQIIETWETCPSRDAEGREYMHMLYKVTRSFRSHLKNMMDTGRMASIQLQQKERQEQENGTRPSGNAVA